MYNPRCGMRRLPSLANGLSNCLANLPAAVRVLLDASIDGETLGRIRRIIERQPAVVEVRSLLAATPGGIDFSKRKSACACGACKNPTGSVTPSKRRFERKSRSSDAS